MSMKKRKATPMRNKMALWRRMAKGFNALASAFEGKRVKHQGRKNKTVMSFSDIKPICPLLRGLLNNATIGVHKNLYPTREERNQNESTLQS